MIIFLNAKTRQLTLVLLGNIFFPDFPLKFGLAFYDFQFFYSVGQIEFLISYYDDNFTIGFMDKYCLLKCESIKPPIDTNIFGGAVSSP